MGFQEWDSFTYRGIDVSVSFLQGNLDSLLNFSGLGLPSSESNGWDLGPGVEGERLSVQIDL